LTSFNTGCHNQKWQKATRKTWREVPTLFGAFFLPVYTGSWRRLLLSLTGAGWLRIILNYAGAGI
jgi:hypothetical protein